LEAFSSVRRKGKRSERHSAVAISEEGGPGGGKWGCREKGGAEHHPKRLLFREEKLGMGYREGGWEITVEPAQKGKGKKGGVFSGMKSSIGRRRVPVGTHLGALGDPVWENRKDNRIIKQGSQDFVGRTENVFGGNTVVDKEPTIHGKRASRID